MTKEQAQAELESVTQRTTDLWPKVKAAQDVLEETSRTWHSAYERKCELETFLKLTEAEVQS